MKTTTQYNCEHGLVTVVRGHTYDNGTLFQVLADGQEIATFVAKGGVDNIPQFVVGMLLRTIGTLPPGCEGITLTVNDNLNKFPWAAGAIS